MDDYPNSSETWAVTPPEDRVETEQKEQVKVTTSIGVIRDVLDWFEANADLYASVDSLNVTEETDPAAALIAINTAKKMRAAFQSKGAAFRSEFAQYLTEEKPE